MPHNDPDPTDPMTLHGVVVETEDDTPIREMAGCFIEEFLRLGFSGERLMQLFKTGEYAGPSMAYQALGEAHILKLIEEHMQLRRPRASSDGVPVHDANGRKSLRVLNS